MPIKCLSCAKTDTYCGKWEKNSKSRCAPNKRKPNVKLIQAIFIYLYCIIILCYVISS